MWDAAITEVLAGFYEIDDATQERVWKRFVPMMNTGSTLYIGHSERVSGPAMNQLRTSGLTTYRLGA